VPSIAYGVAGNVVELPICFRDVASKILQPSRIVFIKVKPCSCIPDSYDMEINGIFQEAWGKGVS